MPEIQILILILCKHILQAYWEIFPYNSTLHIMNMHSKKKKIYREIAEVLDLILDNAQGVRNEQNNTVSNNILDDDSVSDDRTVTSLLEVWARFNK